MFVGAIYIGIDDGKSSLRALLCLLFPFKAPVAADMRFLLVRTIRFCYGSRINLAKHLMDFHFFDSDRVSCSHLSSASSYSVLLMPRSGYSLLNGYSFQATP